VSGHLRQSPRKPICVARDSDAAEQLDAPLERAEPACQIAQDRPRGTMQHVFNRQPQRPSCEILRREHIARAVHFGRPGFDPSEEAPINTLLGHSITYRIATGPREGQKVFTLATLPADPDRVSADVAQSSGFSLHAGVAAKSRQRAKLEHLARYISRPPLAAERLA